MNTSTQLNPAPSYFIEPELHSVIPVEVQFRHMRESKHVLELVEQMMEKFEKYPLPNATVSVVVDETHHRESKGVFQVKVKLFVPGEPLYVAHSMEQTGMNDGVFGAISDVFESIERQLNKRHDRRLRRRHKAFEDAA
ncbi:MAG: HPF/RaiA family ribosome-associated protein [Pontiella sp.]